jgi:peptidylprolyl isomerase
MTITADNTVRIDYVGRLTDGTVFDTSKREVAQDSGLIGEDPHRTYAPLTIDLGDDSVIQGLQNELVGMESGAERTVTIPPEDAYGEYSEDRVASYDRAAFEEMLGSQELEIGIEVETDEGLPGRVTDFDAEEVTVDFNHELAGETLEFEIEVLEVR